VHRRGLITVGFLWQVCALASAALELSPDDIDVASPAGTEALRRQAPGAAVWQLLPHFVTQQTQSYCSVATSVILLNALASWKDLLAPVDPVFTPHPYFTQDTIFGKCARALPSHVSGRNISAPLIATHGATLEEWQAYMSCFANASAVHAGQSSPAAFRAAVNASLGAFPDTPRRLLGINFHRTEIGEHGGGHMSPVAAYDAEKDRILILDVSRYKYPPVWVPLSKVFLAMNTTDSSSRISRGWLTVGMPEHPQTPDAKPPAKLDWKAIKACIDALEEDDNFGVAICMKRQEVESEGIEPPGRPHHKPAPAPPAGVVPTLELSKETKKDVTLCVVSALCGAVVAVVIAVQFGHDGTEGGVESIPMANIENGALEDSSGVDQSGSVVCGVVPGALPTVEPNSSSMRV